MAVLHCGAARTVRFLRARFKNGSAPGESDRLAFCRCALIVHIRTCRLRCLSVADREKRVLVFPLAFEPRNRSKDRSMSTQSSVSPVAPNSPARRLAWLGKKLFPVGLFLVAGVALVVLVGVAQRIGWIKANEGEITANSTATGQIFTCPMHPQIRQPAPGRCPICGM